MRAKTPSKYPLALFAIIYLVGLSAASTPAATPTTTPTTTRTTESPSNQRKWENEMLKKIQEVYRPLNMPGSEFLGKLGFHHTGVIATTMNDEDILIHSYPGKAVEITVMSLAVGLNERSHWKSKTEPLKPKSGTSVRDAMNAALKGGGGSYRLLHNNCNDVSSRVVEALQEEAPTWRWRRRKKRSAL